jgi:apolipoprotein N-acyltransferase
MKKYGWIVIAFVIPAVSYYFLFHEHSLWWLAWLAPLPILLIVPKLPVWVLFGGSWISYWIGSFGWWKLESFALPNVFVFWGIHLLFALGFALVMVGTKKTHLLFYPVIWTSFDFLVSIFSPHGTWGSLAYTQADVLPIMQVTSITGIYGVTFCVSLFPAMIAYLFQVKKWNWKPIVISVVYILFMALVWMWGDLRMNSGLEQVKSKSLQIGLIAGNKWMSEETRNNQTKILSFLSNELLPVKSIAQKGAKWIILPEKMIAVNQKNQKVVENLLSQTAKENQVYLLIGVERIKSGKWYNTAWLYSPTGEKILEYDKIHLVPGLESHYMESGSELAIGRIDQLAFGVVICKDMDYPATIREYGKKKLDVLFVPALDWKGSEWMHSRMAIVRGIENGFPLVRSTKEGIVSISDPYGRLLLEASTFKENEVNRVAKLNVTHIETVYVKYGDWFGWSMLAIAIIGLVMSLMKINVSKRAV